MMLASRCGDRLGWATIDLNLKLGAGVPATVRLALPRAWRPAQARSVIGCPRASEAGSGNQRPRPARKAQLPKATGKAFSELSPGTFPCRRRPSIVAPRRSSMRQAYRSSDDEIKPDGSG